MRDRVESVLDAAMAAIRDLRDFSGIALQGLGWASEATRVHEIVASSPGYSSDRSLIDAHREQAERAEAFSSVQRPAGFPYLWNLATVRLWTILEVLIDEMVAAALANPEELSENSVVYRLQAPVLIFSSLDADARTDTLLELLKEKTRASLKPGVGRIEALLDPVGLGGAVPDPVRRTVLELSQARHSIVHRNGIADRRFLDRCPWVHCELGAPLPTGQPYFRLYGLSVDWYIVELDLRVAALVDEPVRDEALQLKQDLESRMASAIAARVEQLEAGPDT